MWEGKMNSKCTFALVIGERGLRVEGKRHPINRAKGKKEIVAALWSICR